MKTQFKLLAFLLLFLSFLQGCGAKSEVTPLFEAKSACQQQGRADGLCIFSNSFTIEPEDGVSSPTQIKIPVMGALLNGLFNTITNGLGNIILDMQKNRDVPLDPIEFDIPRDEIDYEMIRELSISEMKLEVVEPIITLDHNFKFIEKVQIFIPMEKDKHLSRTQLEMKKGVLLAEYNIKDKTFTCQEKKCIKFKIKDLNLLELTRTRDRLFIKPFIVVNNVPAKEFKMKVTIKVEVKLKLPF